MKEIIPIKPSTGGTVAIPNIVGRKGEIKEFWGILEKQGIALFAERRFGKSSILRKMSKENKKGFVAIYQPVEGISSPNNFAQILANTTKETNLIEETFFNKLTNIYNSTAEIIEEVKGLKIKKLEHTWQKQLYCLLQKLNEQNRRKRIIIMLDEFSIFLNKIEKKEAISVIGFLRNITYENGFENIRFVYCGSIGIDLVLDKIKSEGHNIGDPLNHMFKYELQTFTKTNAEYFGQCLNAGCQLSVSKKNIKQICKKANYIPYFIDIVFDKLDKAEKSDIKAINIAFDEIINDTQGKESIKHFYDRIERFYPNPNMSILTLNFISLNKNYSTEQAIANNLQSHLQNTDRIEINREIERLKNDGYLIRKFHNDERIYEFKYSLLKSWWKRNKAF